MKMEHDPSLTARPRARPACVSCSHGLATGRLGRRSPSVLVLADRLVVQVADEDREVVCKKRKYVDAL